MRDWEYLARSCRKPQHMGGFSSSREHCLEFDGHYCCNVFDGNHTAEAPRFGYGSNISAIIHLQITNNYMIIPIYAPFPANTPVAQSEILSFAKMSNLMFFGNFVSIHRHSRCWHGIG